MFRRVHFNPTQTINKRFPIKVEQVRFTVCPKPLSLTSRDPSDARIHMMAIKEGDSSEMHVSWNLLIFNERLECIANDLQPDDTVICISGSRTKESNTIIVDDMEVHRVIRGPLQYNVHGDTFQEPGDNRICVNGVRQGDMPTGIFYQSCTLLIFQEKLKNIAQWLKSTDTIEIHSGIKIMRRDMEVCRTIFRVDDMTVSSVVKNVPYEVRGPGSTQGSCSNSFTHIPVTAAYSNKNNRYHDASKYWTHLVFKDYEVRSLASLRIGSIVRIAGTKRVRFGDRTTITVNNLEIDQTNPSVKKRRVTESD